MPQSAPARQTVARQVAPSAPASLREGQSPHPAVHARFVSGALAALIRYATGRLPTWLLLRLLAPLFALTLLVGGGLSAARYAESGTGQWVISHLASPFFNSAGYHFLASALIVAAAVLVPIPPWLYRVSSASQGRRQWGLAVLYVGVAGTLVVGVERLWLPALGTCFYGAHYLYAACGFVGLWLGAALLDARISSPAVRGRWSPLRVVPWTAVPPIIVLAIVAALSIVPSLRLSVRAAWPRELVFLRTVAFWQWYMVLAGSVTFFTALRNAGRQVVVEQPSLASRAA